MTLLETMLKRRSVRTYTQEDIPDEKIKAILKAALLAPTSRNRKPCEFVVVKDKDILKKLSESKEAGSAMLAGCNVAIVVFADSTKADTWIEDASIALTYMDLMAVNMGVGSCWCQSHLRFAADGTSSEDVVRDILSMDEKYRVVGILSLGIAKETPEPHTLAELDVDKVRYI